jgi:murein DD-endopeptidase MepM/ murein hydrolase activator NlpD
VNENVIVAVLLGLLIPVLFLLSQGDAGGPLGLPPVSSVPYHTYTVRTGDTLSQIANRYGIPLSYLVASNDLADPSLLLPGQTLLLPRGGVLHTVRLGQTIADIAKTYGVDEEAIRRANGVGAPPTGTKLLIPEPRVVPQVRAAELGQGKGGRFIWPCLGPISSPFGPRIHPVYGGPDFHTGIDIAIPVGTPVYAAAPGRVIETGTRGGYGLLVVIDHGDGYSTYYAHLSRFLVSEGQFVEAGQAVALSGNTGLSTGPHLHFEIRRYGEPLNPSLFL